MIRNIDVDLMRAFVTIYESGSFSHAADKLGRTQSTISQQIKKLEDILGKDVFLRTKRNVSLTTEGEVLLPYARQMIAVNDEVFGRIVQADISGTVRLGAPEAFATHHLPDVLVQFAKSHPSVALEVDCGLSQDLIQKFDKGDFDIVLFMRDGKTKIYGNKVWKEPLIWVGLNKQKFAKGQTVPLILSPSPCVFRIKMTGALEKKDMKWVPTFTSGNISGRIAAARAGLGVTAIPKEMLSQTRGLVSLEEQCGLPKLSDVEIDLLEHKTMSDAAKRLSEHIIFALENNPSIQEAS